MTAAQLPSTAMREVNPAILMLDPGQPRKHFDEKALSDLVASVSVAGVIQPILVRSFINGCVNDESDENATGAQFRIISGERRWRAAKEAKLNSVPVIVRDDLSEEDVLAMQITENLQRQDLTLSELVSSISRLVAMHNVVTAAKKLGKDKSWVSRINGVGKLWKPVQELIASDHLQSIDAAHDLNTLRDIDPKTAQRLVDEFKAPPDWRATPPTRELIRAELERARKSANNKQSMERERQETQQLRTEQKSEQIADLTKQLSSSKKTPLQKGRDELKEAQDAADKRIKSISLLIATRVLAAFNLKDEDPEFTSGFTVDANGEERWISISGPELDINATAEELRLVDFKKSLWRIELDLSHEELLRLVDAIEGKSPNAVLPPRFQSVREFLDACTQPCEGESVQSEWLFERYGKWCKKNKRECLDTSNEFSSAMEICGIQKKRTKTGRYWMDIKPTGAGA